MANTLMSTNKTSYEFRNIIFDSPVSVFWASSRVISSVFFLMCRCPNSFGTEFEFGSTIFWVILVVFFVRVASKGTVNVTPDTALNPKGSQSD